MKEISTTKKKKKEKKKEEEEMAVCMKVCSGKKRCVHL